MNWAEIYSSEDAREEAEHHRQELSGALDAIGTKLGRTLENAEDRIQKPLNWVRENPWMAIGIGAALGFMIAGRRRRPADLLTRELETAYLEGRRDEQSKLPTKETDYWRDRQLDLREAIAPAADRSILGHLADPVLRAVTATITRAVSGL